MNAFDVKSSNFRMERIRFYQNPHSEDGSPDPQEFIAIHFENDGLTIKSIENTLKKFSDENGACYFQKSKSMEQPSLFSVDPFWPLDTSSLVIEFVFELKPGVSLGSLVFANTTVTECVRFYLDLANFMSNDRMVGR